MSAFSHCSVIIKDINKRKTVFTEFMSVHGREFDVGSSYSANINGTKFYDPCDENKNLIYCEGLVTTIKTCASGIPSYQGWYYDAEYDEIVDDLAGSWSLGYYGLMFKADIINPYRDFVRLMGVRGLVRHLGDTDGRKFLELAVIR